MVIGPVSWPGCNGRCLVCEAEEKDCCHITSVSTVLEGAVWLKEPLGCRAREQRSAYLFEGVEAPRQIVCFLEYATKVYFKLCGKEFEPSLVLLIQKKIPLDLYTVHLSNINSY